MPKVIAGTRGVKLVSDSGQTTVEFAIEYDNAALSGLAFLPVVCYKNGVKVGTPIRFRMSDSADRIYCDLPAVSVEHFQTDANGKIEHG